jgi:hypothetical protein
VRGTTGTPRITTTSSVTVAGARSTYLALRLPRWLTQHGASLGTPGSMSPAMTCGSTDAAPPASAPTTPADIPPTY